MAELQEAVIVSATRSPMGRARKGNYKDTRADDLAAQVLKAAVEAVPNLDPKDIEDIKLGCAMPEGEQGATVARIAGILAGLPLEVAAVTVNRFCSSSLETINQAAMTVMTGMADVCVAGGVESMTHVPMGGFNPSPNEKFFSGEYPAVYIPMGLTAENVAKKYNVSREDMDAFALNSHQKAVAAIENGKFKDEITPIEAKAEDGSMFTVDTDQGPRAETTLEALAGLEPVFVKDGTGSVTAGNSSPLTDGAAACVVMSAKKAKELGVAPLVRIKAFAVAGLEPEYMGMGPVPAVTKLLKRTGMTLGDMDIIEMNEAFAAQALAVIRELGIDETTLNPHGGALALGHPLGATGSRIMATLIHDLIQLDKTVGLETMCIGGGQGLATIVERV